MAGSCPPRREERGGRSEERGAGLLPAVDEAAEAAVYGCICGCRRVYGGLAPAVEGARMPIEILAP